MSIAKVAVSLPDELLRRLDAQAAAVGQTRSAFVRASLEQTLGSLEEERAVREARAIYEVVEQDEALWRMHEAFARGSAETLPPYSDETGAARRPRGGRPRTTGGQPR